MVGIEVSKAKGSYIVWVDSGALEASGERARAYACVDEQETGWRAKHRCVSSRAAGKDAEFKRHWRKRSYRGGEPVSFKVTSIRRHKGAKLGTYLDVVHGVGAAAARALLLPIYAYDDIKERAHLTSPPPRSTSSSRHCHQGRRPGRGGAPIAVHLVSWPKVHLTGIMAQTPQAA